MGAVSTFAEVRPGQRTRFARYRHALWLLTKRDLRVRYSTSALGYVWSILDPLVMSAIYWFVFTQIFKRSVGEDPYIVFLLAALLPWMWFNGAISDSTRAFISEAKLIRSTTIPRTIWVNRLVLSKGIEFLLSLPVLAFFAVVSGARLNWDVLFFPLAVLIQTVLTVGVGLIVAPLVVFFRDLERAVKLFLRFLFYASPIIYSARDLPGGCETGIAARHCATAVGAQADTIFSWHFWAAFNPLTGIFSLYRAAFFPQELDWFLIGVSATMSVLLLLVGLWVFARCERAVLKEI
ncbi:MAG: type transport system permease protein [Microbacteriaceae bacterium]|jgi:ABC-2 type transport system permease protein|nr:type transport system permease protein [Microbacteriaceae bacterium]